MATDRKSFLMYNSHYEAVKNFSDDILGKLMRAVFEYQINGVEPADNDIRLAFSFIKIQLNLDNSKYQKKVEANRENGTNGGRPKTKKKQKTHSVIKKPTETEQKPTVIKKADVVVVEDVVEEDVVVEDLKDIPQGKPADPTPDWDKGTFRKPGKTIQQQFACWYVKTIFPETYRISDANATGEWFRRNGPALSSVVKLAGEDVELFKDVTYAAAEDMKKFSQTQGETIPPSLEVIIRNWDKYLAKAGAMRKKREIETRQKELQCRQEESKRKKEEAESQAYAERLAKTVITAEDREKVLEFAAKINQTIITEQELKETYLYMKDTEKI